MNILVADDHELVRRGLKEILVEEFHELRTGEAKDSPEVIALVEAHAWDPMLLDVLMPGKGIVDLITQIRRRQPHSKILVLTAVSEVEYTVRTLKAGANGYITKQRASDELLEAIRKVLDGETYLNAETVRHLAASFRPDGEPVLPHQKLSPREMEVFCLIAVGKAVKEIAADLHLSDKTIATHLARIREKTGFSNYVEMSRYALQHRLVD